MHVNIKARLSATSLYLYVVSLSRLCTEARQARKTNSRDLASVELSFLNALAMLIIAHII